MQDHGWPFRQKIIHGPEAKKMHYRKLIERGLRHEDAVNMSGYDPSFDFEGAFISLIKFIGVAAMCIGLVMVAAQADESTGVKASEDALVACLNGKPIAVGDEWFFCTKVGKV